MIRIRLFKYMLGCSDIRSQVAAWSRLDSINLSGTVPVQSSDSYGGLAVAAQVWMDSGQWTVGHSRLVLPARIQPVFTTQTRRQRQRSAVDYIASLTGHSEVGRLAASAFLVLRQFYRHVPIRQLPSIVHHNGMFATAAAP